MKNKSKVNFVIDVFMFIVMMSVGGIGFLMKFILVPGSKCWEIYGSNVDLFLWGWDRYQWGSLHLILGFVLLGLLILHIVFHWSQIKGVFRNLIHKKFLRVVLTFLFVLASVILFLFAFIVDFDVITSKSGKGRHRVERPRSGVEPSSVNQLKKNVSNISTVKAVHKGRDNHQDSLIEVYGSMTLEEVEHEYQVPADSVKKFGQQEII